jgi:murein L,D-transpeptidase YcbB/YkuD
MPFLLFQDKNSSFIRQHNQSLSLWIILVIISLGVASCHEDTAKHNKKNKAIHTDPLSAESNPELLQKLIADFKSSSHNPSDSSKLALPEMVSFIYENNEGARFWSTAKKWNPLADSLFKMIERSEYYGLFKEDYHFNLLSHLKNSLQKNTTKHNDDAAWYKTDILLTDACLHLMKDLKYGRINPSQEDFKSDTASKFLTLSNEFIQLLNDQHLSQTFEKMEPSAAGYQQLKESLSFFLHNMNRELFTYVDYPYNKKDPKDSLTFILKIQKRLAESNCIKFSTQLPDSTQLDSAIRTFQQMKGITEDGKISKNLVKLLNNNDQERFRRIAITLDRYKQLPEKMPERYVWVNLPGFYLQLWDHDSILMKSNIICGSPATPTPLLTSSINNMVTYPTWTVPSSIISKQYLPKLKKNPNYLKKLGLKLLNNKGDLVEGNNIDWTKYNKSIPFKVMQASGDNNALGIFKFNFNNSFDVYLHDTNQRYLFKKTSRALSHGCVRVQDWEKLAFNLTKMDSAILNKGDSIKYNTDSIKRWITQKKHKSIQLKNEIPIYISYFGCEGKDGKVIFHEDIYDDDKLLREKYFRKNYNFIQ